MNSHQIEKFFASYNPKEFEDICMRCGACCGAYDNDPCVHLRKGEDGKYYCNIYSDRFGFHNTINGNRIKCIPIIQKLHKGPWIGDGLCGYKKLLIAEYG